jgi:hypothetical protein
MELLQINRDISQWYYHHFNSSVIGSQCIKQPLIISIFSQSLENQRIFLLERPVTSAQTLLRPSIAPIARLQDRSSSGSTAVPLMFLVDYKALAS